MREPRERQVFERECALAGQVGEHPYAADIYRSGFAGRPAVHRHALLHEGKPGRQAQSGAATAGRRGAHHLRAGRHRPAVRAQPGHPAPRRQAREHLVRRVRRSRAGRLRNRDRTRRGHHGPAPRHDPRVRPAGSAQGRRRLALQRRLVAGGHALRPADRAPALLRPAARATRGRTCAPSPGRCHRSPAPTSLVTCRKPWPGRLSANPTAGPPPRGGWPRNSIPTCGCSVCRPSRSASMPRTMPARPASPAAAAGGPAPGRSGVRAQFRREAITPSSSRPPVIWPGSAPTGYLPTSQTPTGSRPRSRPHAGECRDPLIAAGGALLLVVASAWRTC